MRVRVKSGCEGTGVRPRALHGGAAITQNVHPTQLAAAQWICACCASHHASQGGPGKASLAASCIRPVAVAEAPGLAATESRLPSPPISSPSLSLEGSKRAGGARQAPRLQPLHRPSESAQCVTLLLVTSHQGSHLRSRSCLHAHPSHPEHRPWGSAQWE